MKRYTKCVKLIQRVVRDKIACRNARIVALTKIWDKYESQYVGVSAGDDTLQPLTLIILITSALIDL
jgi:hypothetical protein